MRWDRKELGGPGGGGMKGWSGLGSGAVLGGMGGNGGLVEVRLAKCITDVEERFEDVKG